MIDQLLVRSELVVDLRHCLVLDTLRTSWGVGYGSLDFDLTECIFEGFVDLDTADKESHHVRAGAIPELWICLGKVLHILMESSKERHCQ